MPASLPYTTPAPGCILREGTIYAPAGFAPRLWAFLLDAIVLGLLHQLLISIARVGTPDPEQMLKVVSQMVTELMRSGTISSALTSQMEDLESAARLIGWLNVGLCAAYYTIAHGMFGTTLGKYMLGLRVFRRDGNDLGLSLALLRYIGYLLSAKLIYTAWFIPFNPEKRTLYDMIFSTNVFRPVAKFNPAPPPPEYYG